MADPVVVAAILAEERAEDVTRELVPPLVISEVDSKLAPLVDALVPPLLDATVPGMVAENVAAAWKASPPAPGEQGEPGLSVLSGTGRPSDDLGRPGDAYLDTVSGDVWLCS